MSPTGRITVIFDPSGLAAEIVDVFMIQSIELMPPQKRNSRRKAG